MRSNCRRQGRDIMTRDGALYRGPVGQNTYFVALRRGLRQKVSAGIICRRSFDSTIERLRSPSVATSCGRGLHRRGGGPAGPPVLDEIDVFDDFQGFDVSPGVTQPLEGELQKVVDERDRNQRRTVQPLQQRLTRRYWAAARPFTTVAKASDGNWHACCTSDIPGEVGLETRSPKRREEWK